MTKEEISGAKKILKKIRENKGGIYISRIPEKIKKQFIELANEEFCSDYGMCLTFLMKGVVSHESQIILDGIGNLDERVSYLESSFSAGSKESEKPIKLANGKEINKK